MSGTGKVKLQGKSNFVEWQRRFTHVAKTKKVLQLLDGTEKIILERPNGDTFLKAETIRVNNANDNVHKTRNQLATPNTADADTTPPAIPSFMIDIGRVNFQYNEALQIWQANKEMAQKASDLLHEWISEAISIEIVDCKTVADAYQHIMTKYKVNDDRAREDLLDRSISIKLGDFPNGNMQEYLNEHRIVAAELKKLNQEYSDRRKVDNIILGLPDRDYDAFKRQYRFHQRLREEEPDVGKLEELLLEEAKEIDKKKKIARRNNGGQLNIWDRGGP